MTSRLYTILETVTWGLGWRNRKSFFVWYLIASSLTSIIEIYYYLAHPDYLYYEYNEIIFFFVIVTNLLFYLLVLSRHFIGLIYYPFIFVIASQHEELWADTGFDLVYTFNTGYLPIILATLFIHIAYFIHGRFKTKPLRGYNKDVSEIILLDKIEPLSHADLRRFWYCPFDGQPLSPNTTRVMQTPYFLLTRDNLDLGIKNAYAMKKIPGESFFQTRILADYFFSNTDNHEMNLVSVFCPECNNIFSVPRM